MLPPPAAAPAEPASVAVEVDALRGDLYRLLDAIARAAPEARAALLLAFEETWSRFLGELSGSRDAS